MKLPLWKMAPLFLPALVSAADFSSYRGFAFGSDIATVAAQIEAKPSDAVLVHQRPALLQELKWQIRPVAADYARPDPVEDMVLSFMDGKLYRVAAIYGRYKVKGMTVEDIVNSLSSTFGVAQHPKAAIAFRTYARDTENVLARWDDANVSYDLINAGDPGLYALVVYSKKQEAASQAAMLEASRLDALDAPRKAREAETKRLQDERAALEETRAANKLNFRP